MRTSNLVVLFLLSLAATLSGQEPAARAISGVASRGDGSSWSGATVHALWRPVAERPGIGDTERLAVKADERGRFRLPLRRGRRYTVWASGEDEAGSYPVSSVLTAVSVADAPRLREVGRNHHRVLRVKGLDAWQHRGPFRYRLQSRVGSPVVVAGELGEDREIVMPALPGSQATCCVLTADGLLIGWHRVSLRHGKPGSVTMLPPRPVRVWVEREKKGPLAAATFLQNTPWGVEAIATLDAEGRGELDLPIGAEKLPFYGRWFAGGAGMGLGMVDVDKESTAAEDIAFRERGTILGATLFEEKVVEGRLLLSAGKPAVGVPVVVDGSTKVRFPNGGLNARRVVRVARTDAEGRFRIPGLMADEKTMVRAVLPVSVKRQLPRALAGMPDDLVVAVDVTPERAALGDIAFDRDVLALTVQWELPDGRPATGVRAALVETDTMGGPVTRLPSDRLARSNFWVPTGAPFDLVAGHADGVFFGRFSADTVGDAARVIVPIRLDPGVVVSGKVTDQGVPVAGLSVTHYATVSPAPTLPPLLEVAAPLKAGELSPWQARVATYVLSTRLLPCETSKSGVYRTRIPRILGVFEQSSWRQVGEQWLRAEAQLAVESGADTVQNDLVLTKR